MEGERERAEHCLYRLATHFGSEGASPLQRSQSRDRIDAARRVRLKRAGAALTAVGLLSELEVERFRRLLEDEIARGVREQPPVSGELARRTRDLLSARLCGVAESAADRGTSAQQRDRHADAVERFQCVLDACGRCGALGDDECLQWQERVCEADGGRTWSLERDRRAKRCTLTELRAVVLGDATRIGGARIATAELYADGVVLRWDSGTGVVPTPSLQRTDDPAGAGWYPPAPVSVADDVGTEYLHVHTSQVMRVPDGPVGGTSTFATAVAPAATQLVAQIGEHRLTVVLPGLGEPR